MRRTIVFVCLLLLAACGGGGGDRLVATVNGSPINVSNVESLTVVEGGAAMPTDQFASYLTAAIVDRVVVDNAKSEYGIEAAQADLDQARADAVSQIEASGTTFADFLAGQKWTEDFVQLLLRRQVIGQKLGVALAEAAGPVPDADVQAKMAEYTARTIVCAKHILVATEAEADAAKLRLDAGEDFGAVARELSTDTGSGANGGELGCAAPETYVADFAAATKNAVSGVVTDPIQTEFGFHLILVEDPTIEKVREEIDTTRATSLYLEWEGTAIRAAEITVEEKYGTWATDPQPQVLPPQ